MGCDIHFFVEVRLPNGPWQFFREQLRACKNINHNTECYWCNGTGWECKQLYSGRDYQLFAVLAGVRNYMGIMPIAQPRGVPTDLDARTSWEMDMADHSCSWFTLKELIAVDWDREFTVTFDDEYDLENRRQIQKTVTTSYRKMAGEEFMETLDALRRRTILYDPNDVRAVFGFDN